MVDRPGTFAISSAKRAAIVWPVSAAPALSRGSGRQGFHLLSGGHVTITGFRFVNYAGGDTLSRHAATPIVQLNPLPGITLAGNAQRAIVALGRPARDAELAAGIPSPLVRHATAFAEVDLADMAVRTPATIRGRGAVQMAGASAPASGPITLPMSETASGR
jgi:hypothetical protein